MELAKWSNSTHKQILSGKVSCLVQANVGFCSLMFVHSLFLILLLFILVDFCTWLFQIVLLGKGFRGKGKGTTPFYFLCTIAYVQIYFVI